MGLLDDLSKDLLGGVKEQLANQAEKTIDNATKNLPGNKNGEITDKLVQAAEDKLGVKHAKSAKK